jgi:hypothetical protein
MHSFLYAALALVSRADPLSCLCFYPPWRSIPDFQVKSDQVAKQLVLRSEYELARAAHEINEFAARHARLPSTLAETDSRGATDPWGTALEYRPQPGGTYTLRSAGPDRQFGTADDIWRGKDPTVDAGFDAGIKESTVSRTPEG